MLSKTLDPNTIQAQGPGGTPGSHVETGAHGKAWVKREVWPFYLRLLGASASKAAIRSSLEAIRRL